MPILSSIFLSNPLHSSPGPLEPGDRFIVALIFVEMVPEIVSLPVLQYQICNFAHVSHRNYSGAFTTSYHVIHYPVYTEITRITSWGGGGVLEAFLDGMCVHNRFKRPI